MLNHRRPSHRPKNAPGDDFGSEQAALLSSDTSTDTRQPVYLHGQSSDNRLSHLGSSRRDHLSEAGNSATTTLPMNNLVYPTRIGASTAQLTSRHSQLSNISHASSINFSDSATSSNGRPNFIYYTLLPGDTLQNLSNKYSCSVASIKRINNLWSDQEFHALARIKLPVGKFNLIANVIEEEERLESTTETSSVPHSTHKYTNSALYQHQFPDNTSLSGDQIPDSHHKTIQAQLHTSEDTPVTPDSVFKELDLNIEKARSAAKHYDNHANAILQSLVDSGNIVDEEEPEDKTVLIARQQAETLLNDMTEFGMTSTGLILFIFIVCLIFPLAYVIYLEETHHATRHQ